MLSTRSDLIRSVRCCHILVMVVLFTGIGYAKQTMIVGGEERPWQDTGTTPGEVVDIVDHLDQVRTVDGVQLFIEIPEDIDGWIVPLRLLPDFNISRGVLARGGSIDVPNIDPGQRRPAELVGMLNGDHTIAFDRTFTAERTMRNYGVRIIIDLGARFGVNRIRFYPRMTPDYPFHHQYLPAYEIYLNDGLPENLFASGQPMFGSPVVRDDSNSETLVDLSIEPQFARYLELRSLTQAGFEIDQIEIYGTGFVPRARYLSNVIDLGDQMIFGTVRWQESIAGEARHSRVDIRMRSGPDPDPEADTWSSWQLLRSGQQLNLPAPRRYVQFSVDFSSQRLDAARAIGELAFEYATPPVDRIIAEVSPDFVQIGQPETFTYAARIVNTSDRPGFEHLRIQTPARVEAVHEVQVIDPSGHLVAQAVFDPHLAEAPLPILQGEFAIEAVEDDHFALGLPVLVQDGTLLKVVFDTAVFRYGTPFDGHAYTHREAELYLLTEGGNATDELGTDGVLVRVTVDSRIVGELLAEPALITPDGDGINEQMSISYSVLHLLEPAPAQVRIYALSGRLVRVLSQTSVVNGRYVVTWDGRDDQDNLLPPGQYLVQLQVEASRTTGRRTILVGLAY